MKRQTPTSAHSPVVVEAFYGLCNQAHKTWRIQQLAFQENHQKFDLALSWAGDALRHFRSLSQESFMHQISKLHDPAMQNGRANLTVEYMVRFGGWDEITEQKLQELKGLLDELADKVRPARHRILSHNDLEAILSKATLGQFPEGEDTTYFRNLQDFCDVIRINVIGQKEPFTNEAEAVVKGLLWFFRDESLNNQPTTTS